jgi:hypothetical protein
MVAGASVAIVTSSGRPDFVVRVRGYPPVDMMIFAEEALYGTSIYDRFGHA